MAQNWSIIEPDLIISGAKGMDTSSLYSTIYKNDSLSFGANKKTDYKKIADFLGLSSADVGKLSGVSTKSVRYDARMPEQVKERLDEIKNVCLLVADHFQDPEKTALWFRTINPLLGNVSPRDMLRFGRYKKLMQFIIDARKLTGQDRDQKEQ
jgi:hypothetical protein